jgi:methyltransferase (TIGR00027 family)
MPLPTISSRADGRLTALLEQSWGRKIRSWAASCDRGRSGRVRRAGAGRYVTIGAMATPQLPPGVTRTAVLTCYARAQESRSDSPLFQDPLADYFVSAATGVDSSPGSQLPRLGPARDDGSSALWNSLHWTFAGRTPFFDQQVMDAVGRGVRQVVLLAAGMDCRAYRLPLPTGTVVYELDLRPLLAFKEQILAAYGATPVAGRVAIPADLSGDWASSLVAAGFDPQRPAMWMAEGLAPYITTAEGDALLSAITAMSAPGSSLALDHYSRGPRIDDVALDDDAERATWQLFVTAARQDTPRDPGTWLTEHGWDFSYCDLCDEVSRLGLPRPPLFDRPGPDALRCWLVSATVPGTG